jgi:hypothetical protein
LSEEEEEAFFSCKEKTKPKENDFIKKEKIKFSAQQVVKFEAEGVKQKAIANISGYTDRTVRN